MKNENLKQILDILIQALEINDYGEDKEKIQYLFKELKKIENQVPEYNKLEELHKTIIDLEVKYDEFNELSYYFNPLYVLIKNKIHTEYVKKIREENRRKRNI